MNLSEQRKWWREAKFGLFIHWGLYSLMEKGEQVMYQERIPAEEYGQLAARFNPAAFDADAWVQLAKDAGMKYIVVTAKHHDGFPMFRTHTDLCNIADGTPFGRDVLEELAEACRRENIKLGFCYSHVRDWRHPMAQSLELQGRGDRLVNCGNFWDYPGEHRKNLQKYIDEVDVPQLKELLTGYGDVLTVRFDAPSLIRPDQAQQLKQVVREAQPGCLISSLLSEDTETDYLCADDRDIPAAGSDLPWETALSAAGAWGYRKNDSFSRWEDMLTRLIDAAGRGGNLLLNAGPDAQGVIPEEAQRAFRRIGAWLKENGEAIYGTCRTPFPTEPAWGRVTRKGNCLYLIATDPAAREIALTGLRSRVKDCRALDTGKILNFTESHDDKADFHRLTVRLTGMMGSFRAVKLELIDSVSVSSRIWPDGNGKIILTAAQAEIASESGSLRVGRNGVSESWTDARDQLRWQFFTDRPGRYMLSVALAAGLRGLMDSGHEINIELDGSIYGLTAPDSALQKGGRERSLPVAQVYLAPGRHVLTIAPEMIVLREGVGLTLRECVFSPV